MKIGIITFHWGTNYGGVLQAYALQTYLSQYGHDIKIIDYVPYTLEKKLVKCFITKCPWQIPRNLLEYIKEYRFKKFRTKHLNLSCRYQSIEDLQNNPPAYDVYICGSDQIWNPSFAAFGERKPTLSYFLDFGPTNIKRIAYAVSFGCTQYPKELIKLVAPSLSKFDAVSVRENSGRQIVHQMGIENVWLLPDPTLLLQMKDYDNLLLSPRKIESNYSFFYTLQTGQKTIKKVKKYFSNHLRRRIIDVGSNLMGIEDWLTYIKSSDFVVTNSFHGVVFAIMYRKSFIVVPVEGSLCGMNDRIFTLVGKIGLKSCILDSPDEHKINNIINYKIEWADVDEKIDSLRKNASCYFKKYLK